MMKMRLKILCLFVLLLFIISNTLAQSGTTGPLIWEINNGTLTISGEGEMPDYIYPNYSPWRQYQASINIIIIEAGVTNIGAHAFQDCRNFSSITLPEGITSIGKYAFEGCYNIASISIPNSVTNIGECAFSTCISIDSIIIPSGVKNIEPCTFESCNNLTSIILSNGVKTIGEYAFCSCGNLTSIEIPASVISIGGNAFSLCYALTSVTLSDGLLDIAENCFWNCESLTSINIPNSVKNIGRSAFQYCKSLTSVYMSNGVSILKEHLFSECINLISINLPNSITSINGRAFEKCTRLSSITLPNSVTKIDGCAFFDCISLASINIPYSVTIIGDWSFAGCISLTSINNLNPIPVKISSNAFEGVVQSKCYLEVPIGSVSAYKKAAVWKNFILADIYLVTVKVNNDEYGMVIGGGIYEGNSTAIVTATAKNGYKFENWTKNGIVISADKLYSFNVTEDVELLANFKENVGVVETDNYSSIQVYPNPTIGELAINNKNLTIINVEIFDIFGKKISPNHLIPKSSHHLINISHFPAGIYFVKISTETGEVIRKIVKE